jgi:hypothetical protein
MVERQNPLKEQHERTTGLIRNAISPMPSAVRDEVEHFLSHNELGLAFDVVLDELNKRKTPLTVTELERLRTIAESMGYRPDALEAVIRLTETKD